MTEVSLLRRSVQRASDDIALQLVETSSNSGVLKAIRSAGDTNTTAAAKLASGLSDRGVQLTTGNLTVLKNLLDSPTYTNLDDLAEGYKRVTKQTIVDAANKGGDLLEFRNLLVKDGYLDLRSFRNSLQSMAVDGENIGQFEKVTEAFRKFSDEIMTPKGALTNINLDNTARRLERIDELKKARLDAVSKGNVDEVAELDIQIDAENTLLKSDIESMANDASLYEALSETLGVPTSDLNRFMDRSFFDKISNAGTYLTKKSPSDPGPRTWFHTFRDLGIGAMILWVLSGLGIDDDLTDSLTNFMEEIIGVGGEIATEFAAAGGESLWALLKPLMIPIGILCGLIFIVVIYFISKGGNPKDLVK